MVRVFARQATASQCRRLVRFPDSAAEELPGPPTNAKVKAFLEATGLEDGDGVFFSAGKKEAAYKLAGAARLRIGEELDLVEKGVFRFCWIVDFPMYEYDEDNKKVDFSHNPFSMPQGGLKALEGTWAPWAHRALKALEGIWPMGPKGLKGT